MVDAVKTDPLLQFPIISFLPKLENHFAEKDGKPSIEAAQFRKKYGGDSGGDGHPAELYSIMSLRNLTDCVPPNRKPT